jgi:2-octaprenyl-6-methoxyphenol hydroxylase
MTDSSAYDVAVVGTGPAGLAAALSLAQQGFRVAAIGAQPPRRDTRTAALFGGSVTLLKNLGLSAVCRDAGEPIYGIRIIDDMGGLLRAPEVTFTAAEAGLERLGFNIPNAALVEAMRTQAIAVPTLSLIDAAVTQVVPAADGVTLQLADGAVLAARLVVGADGRQSLCRPSAGIALRTWADEQSAVACTFSHQRPHRGI